MKTIKVEVTEEDIAKGEEGEPCLCPVALALLRILPDVDVHVVDRYLDYGRTIRMPYAVMDFIEDFDSGCEVQPFTFEVELP